MIADARLISSKLKPSRRWDKMKYHPEIKHPGGAEVWQNRTYDVTVRKSDNGFPLGGGPWAQIGICSHDGEARHDWRDFQAIKNDVLGVDWEAIELYPAEKRLQDPSNFYILFASPDIRIGIYHPRNVVDADQCVAPQRPLPKPVLVVLPKEL